VTFFPIHNSVFGKHCDTGLFRKVYIDLESNINLLAQAEDQLPSKYKDLSSIPNTTIYVYIYIYTYITYIYICTYITRKIKYLLFFHYLKENQTRVIETGF
jgi:hypothetical protein